VEIYSFGFRHTRGVSWVRQQIQNSIENKKYYLQIDSHIRFGIYEVLNCGFLCDTPKTIKEFTSSVFTQY
jgi:hypothetical protein